MNHSVNHSAVSSRFYTELDKYVATIITIFKNGDSWYPGHELRFLPGRDFRNLDGLFQKANERLDFLGGVKYMWDTEGVRVTSLDQVTMWPNMIFTGNKATLHMVYECMMTMTI